MGISMVHKMGNKQSIHRNITRMHRDSWILMASEMDYECYDNVMDINGY